MPETRPEFALIDWIRTNLSSREADGILNGIGDDCAVLAGSESELLVTSDMLMDGVHFKLDEVSPERVGHKILGVNLSDIAAMAGIPRAAFVSLAIPKSMSMKTVQAIMVGMNDLASQFDVTIAGGDTNSWDGPFVANITLLGRAISKGPVLRSTAQVGDSICITGSLGGSIIGKHLDVQPRVQEALALHQNHNINSMVDISDGLIGDLFHILNESNVGARLDEAKIPISDAAQNRKCEKTPLEQALGDGEDFELLFTVPKKESEKLLSNNRLETPVTVIGEIVAGEISCEMGSRKYRESDIPGWSHTFKQ